MSDRDYYRLYKKYKKKYLQLSAGAESDNECTNKCFRVYESCAEKAQKNYLEGQRDTALDSCESQQNDCEARC